MKSHVRAKSLVVTHTTWHRADSSYNFVNYGEEIFEAMLVITEVCRLRCQLKTMFSLQPNLSFTQVDMERCVCRNTAQPLHRRFKLTWVTKLGLSLESACTRRPPTKLLACETELKTATRHDPATGTVERAQIRDFYADDDAKFEDPVHVAFQDGEGHKIERLTVAIYRQNLESKAHSKVPHWTWTHHASKLEACWCPFITPRRRSAKSPRSARRRSAVHGPARAAIRARRRLAR